MHQESELSDHIFFFPALRICYRQGRCWPFGGPVEEQPCEESPQFYKSAAGACQNKGRATTSGWRESSLCDTGWLPGAHTGLVIASRRLHCVCPGQGRSDASINRLIRLLRCTTRSRSRNWANQCLLRQTRRSCNPQDIGMGTRGWTGSISGFPSMRGDYEDRIWDF